MAVPIAFIAQTINDAYRRIIPSRYGAPMTHPIKRELEELGLFNLQMTAAGERDVQTNENMVRFTIKAMLAVFSPVPKDYPAKHDPTLPQPSRRMPVTLPDFRKEPAQQNMAPEGWTWVFYVITASSSVSYDHAATELKMLTEMYIATKQIHQPRPTT